MSKISVTFNSFTKKKSRKHLKQAYNGVMSAFGILDEPGTYDVLTHIEVVKIDLVNRSTDHDNLSIKMILSTQGKKSEIRTLLNPQDEEITESTEVWVIDQTMLYIQKIYEEKKKDSRNFESITKALAKIIANLEREAVL